MILILILIFGAVSVSAAEPFAAWRYHGRIQAPRGRFVALPLLPQNLDVSGKPDLSDFRIVDARGLEVPYAVVFETEITKETSRKGTELNREFPDSSTSRATYDFGTGVTKNRITVETAGNSFRRFLQVEGSDDLRTWAMLLPEGWLFAAGDTPERRFESLDIGSNTYRYIRVSVRKMPEEKKQPEIKQVSFFHTVVRKPPESPVQGLLTAYGTKDGISTAEADFHTRNLPMQRFRLLLGRDAARIFEKRCAVSGRNSLFHPERIRFESGEYSKEQTVPTPWAHLGHGSIYRNTRGEMSLDLRVPARFRFIRIEIENGDSPPLDIKGVSGYTVPVYLVFEPAGQSGLDIYTGNPDAVPPRYDSSKMLSSLDTATLLRCPPAALTRLSGTPAGTQPKGQRWIWIVLAGVFLFTCWIFWNTARNIGKERSA